ncbi:MAG: DUF1987 domain-containing protein [Bacteroidales bacterium]|nr:DUF1987 domain-containing protein [Bacteroidales bacterium]
MKAFKAEATEFTPKIYFDPDNLPFIIAGVSRPENANEFYEPVIDWLRLYKENPLIETDIDFQFDYFNTSSLKYFLIILSQFKEIVDSGKKVRISWYYDEEDDSMLEAGRNLEELSELNFKFRISE